MYHKYSKDNRRHKGLSIIEVVTASVLLVVAMAPILSSLTNANMLSSKIEKETQALILAQGELESIRANAAHSFGSSGSFTASNVVLSGSYLCNITDTTITANYLKQITVSVGYDASGNGTLSSSEILVTLTTYIANGS